MARVTYPIPQRRPVAGPRSRLIGAALLVPPAGSTADATDAITLVDAATRGPVSLVRSCTDGLTFVDTPTRLAAYSRAIVDGATFAEATAAQAGKTRGVTDSLGLADVVS